MSFFAQRNCHNLQKGVTKMENDDHLAVLNINVGTAGVLEPENVKEIRDFIDGVFTTFVPGKPFTTTGIRLTPEIVTGKQLNGHHFPF